MASGVRLSPEVREQIRRLRATGLSGPRTAAALGVSLGAAYTYSPDVTVDARPATNRARAPAPPWLPEARRLLASGVSRNEAAAKLGVAKSNFYRIVARFGAHPVTADPGSRP